MKHKAVSPLIATVLLIVITLGISAIIINWATPMAKKNLENSNQNEYDRDYCATAQADIISIVMNSENKTTISIQNLGTVPLNLSEAYIYNKNQQSCLLEFDSSYLDVGDFARATNNSCSILANCNDFLLVDVKTTCKNILVRYNGELKSSINGGCAY